MSDHIHHSGELLIDRYKLLKYIDEGGMQQVYLANDLSFDREVVVKVPKNSSAEKRFKRSACVSARINHENVAKTLDYFEYDNRSYLVEEYIQGHDLSAALKTDFRMLDPHLTAHVIHHVAKGLAASHHAGVFHRDLKPSNIMVSKDLGISAIKITDFGIAKMAEEEIFEGLAGGESSITGSQTLVGALPYMAPEMIETPQQADRPADIWAVGAMAYQLLSGKHPFGSGLSAVPKIIEATPPSQPSLINSKSQFRSIGNAIWDVIIKCLQKLPSERPSADELVDQCSTLCYSTEKRETGVIRDYAAGSGSWGFIDKDDGGSIFFHGSSYYGKTPETGKRVCFTAYQGLPSPRAFPVLPLKDL